MTCHCPLFLLDSIGHCNRIMILYARLLDDTDRDVRAAGGAEVEPPLKLKGNKLETEMSTA